MIAGTAAAVDAVSLVERIIIYIDVVVVIVCALATVELVHTNEH